MLHQPFCKKFQMSDKSVIVHILLVKTNSEKIFYNVCHLLDYAGYLINIVHNRLVHPCIGQMKGNKTCFILWKPYLTFLPNSLQSPQANLKFLFIKSSNIPQQNIFYRNPIQKAHNGCMYMINQGYINHIV